jgi:tRNA A-37 threonylcarbamoyl transferase component Bud32
MDVTTLAPFANAKCPDCGEHTRVKCEFGPYTLVRRHAVGGMSMVFVARDSTLHREVAVKILSEDFSANERRIIAFEEEARITASFSHPNVVRVLTTGRAFGRFYIAMEFVSGGHFEHQIRERGKIPEAEVLHLAIEVAQGLKAAHAAGLIHRDVKPGNILLNADGQVKLVDFGLSLVTQGGKAQATEVWATPYYVPPETVEGGSEDFRSDIYAFGATLYHALTGKPSCNEESMATDILRDAKKRVLPLGLADHSISPETCRIVDRAMAYHPDARFSSYDEMIGSIETVLNHLKSGRSELSDTAAVRRAGKKHKERVVIGVVVLGLLFTVALALVWVKRRPPAIPEVVPAPVVSVPPPVVDDPSTEIARNYREARAAMAAKDFEKAAQSFARLHRNPAVQEPTRTWAGVEAVLADLLAGHAADARNQARETAKHAHALPSNNPGIGEGVITTLDQLQQLPPLAEPKPDRSAGGTSHLIACMLAGLKNWEQGMQDPAVACFTAALASKLPQEDSWATIYQAFAADYLADSKILSSALFTAPPSDKAARESAISALEAALPILKTQGRARFNVRAWQLDLTRQIRLAAPSAAVPVSKAPPSSQ